MLTSSCKISELQNQLSEDIENVIQSMADDFVIVGTQSKMRDCEETLCITVRNEIIHRAPFVTFSGFFTDENLDWGDHVSNVLKKVSSGLTIVTMSKNYLPRVTLKILYNSLIETHFGYYLGLTSLQKLQNRESTNNYWFGLRYSSRTFNRATRVENSWKTDKA